MDLDDRQLNARLARAEKTIARISRNTLNDAAFEASTETPDYLKEAIDRPMNFTAGRSVARVATIPAPPRRQLLHRSKKPSHPAPADPLNLFADTEVYHEKIKC